MKKIYKTILVLMTCLVITGCSAADVVDLMFEDKEESEETVVIPDNVKSELSEAKNMNFSKLVYLTPKNNEMHIPLTLGGQTVAKVEVFYVSKSVDEARIALDSNDGTLHISTYDDASDKNKLFGVRNSRSSIPGDSNVSLTSLYILTNYKSETSFDLTVWVPEDTETVMVVSSNANEWQKTYKANTDYRSKIQKNLAYGISDDSLYKFDVLYDVASTVDDPYSGLVPKEREFNSTKSIKGIVAFFAFIGFAGITGFFIWSFIKKKKAKEEDLLLVSSRIEQRSRDAAYEISKKEISDLETLVSEYDALTDSQMYEDEDINERFSDDIYSSTPDTKTKKEERKKPSWMLENKTPAWMTESVMNNNNSSLF